MTPSSKIAFQTKLQTLAQSIQLIYNKLERIIIIYIKEFNITAARKQGAKPNKADDTLFNVGRVITRMISTFCVYRMIKEQIESGNFYVIELNNFEHEVKRLSDRNPEVRMFLAQFKQEIDPRLHPKNIGDKVEQTADFEAAYEKALRNLSLRVRGGEPSETAKQFLKAQLKKEFLEKMQKDTLTAYEHELGRPMSSEERQLFFPISSAASSSAVVPAPAALVEGEQEEEVPAIEEVGAEETAETKRKRDEIEEYVRSKLLEVSEKYGKQGKTQEDFFEGMKRATRMLNKEVEPKIPNESLEILLPQVDAIIQKSFFF
jgi:hypothetical protein